ncbi:hypothetical protein QQF64_008310 [Cirrhinus molitorella]|uniref:Uncharacterized protein n=1 Tax=Cirrhinus molitorella TaxID=172907 RepID=A0ABR3M5S2_9TELE
MSDFPPKPTPPPSIPGQARSGEGGALGFSSDVFILDAVGGGDMNLGELADLTVANDNDLTIDLQDSREEFKKTWNPRFTLRSHFDAIRALTFHPSQAVLLSASEDGTLKLWNLNKAMHSKKNAALDVEPIYTFRAHSGAVLSLAMGRKENHASAVVWMALSAAGRFQTLMWILTTTMIQAWRVACSDGTVRIWDPHNSSPCVSVFNKEKEHGTPTSVAFVNSDPSQVVVSFDGGETLLYDLNTEQSIMVLENQAKDGSELINRVVSHPSQPISITAHENRTIRFLDNKTGKVIHSMVAHLDAVTCLATDPKGTYLISGSHDCSVRLWMLDNRTPSSPALGPTRSPRSLFDFLTGDPPSLLGQKSETPTLSTAGWLRDLSVTPLPPGLCEVQTVERWRQGEEGVSSVVFSLRHSRHGSTRQETETQSDLQSKPNQELSPACFLYLEAILS